MNRGKTFTVIGGDLRQAHLSNMLAGRDTDYHIYGMFMEKDVKLSSRITKSEDIRLVLPQSDILLFPLPLQDADGNVNTPLSDRKVPLEECFAQISPDALVLGGMIGPRAVALARKRGIELVDYYRREEFAVMNAVPTAEGAVEIALSELPVTLFGSVCMITGYGRIAKALARLLHAFGAEVRIVARDYGELAQAKTSGYIAVHISDLTSHLKDIDVLFNTVPAVILDEDKLSRLSRSCLVIDLASKPGGVDFETAKLLGLKAIWALSLPGRVAPVSAGEIILETAFNILRERGMA